MRRSLEILSEMNKGFSSLEKAGSRDTADVSGWFMDSFRGVLSFYKWLCTLRPPYGKVIWPPSLISLADIRMLLFKSIEKVEFLRTI